MKSLNYVLGFCLFFILSFTVLAQDSEYFVIINEEDETFEIVSPIDGVIIVVNDKPAFSDALGQYTFFQAIPETAAITIDIESGEILYYKTLPNFFGFVFPTQPVRINDGRVLSYISYIYSFDVIFFDPSAEGDEELLLTYNTQQAGNVYGSFSAYNPFTNKFYIRYGYDTNQEISFVVEIDVDSGTVSNEITTNRIVGAMFPVTGSADMLVICEDNQSFGKQIGYLNTSTGEITLITTALALPSFNLSCSSLDEENKRIYISEYSYQEGSFVHTIDYGSGSIEYNEHLILESEYSEDEWGSPVSDTSHNVLNAYYSNIRNQLYGIHWGSGPLVQVDAFEQPLIWSLHSGSAQGSYLLKGLQKEVPKSLSIMDTNGRLIISQDFITGNEIEIRLPDAAGIYIVVLTEDRKRQAFKLVRD